MNKVYGIKEKFIPIRSDRSRLIISYNCQPLEDNIHAIWCEIYFYKKPHPYVSDEEIKSAILEDIDNEVKRLIIETMIWEGKPIWLSLENQSNFSTAEHRAATTGDNLPHKEKIGKQEDGTPIYHTFETAAELTDFWNACQDHIDSCRKAGWKLKDSINWDDYKV